MSYVHLTIVLWNHFTKVGLLRVPQIFLELTFLHTCASKVLGSANIQCCYVELKSLSPFSDISVEHISLEDPCPLSIFFSSLATFPGLRWHLRELDLLSCLPPTGMLQPRPPLTALFGFVSVDSGPRRETSSDGRVGGKATHAFTHPSPWRDSIPSQGHGCQDRS